MIAVDTNLLVYAHRAGVREHRAAQRAIEAAANDPRGWGISLPRAGFAVRLMQLASDLRVAGVRVFDLQIGLTAFDNGAAEIWSHDAAFVRIPGLAVVDPLA